MHRINQTGSQCLGHLSLHDVVIFGSEIAPVLIWIIRGAEDQTIGIGWNFGAGIQSAEMMHVNESPHWSNYDIIIEVHLISFWSFRYDLTIKLCLV